MSSEAIFDDHLSYCRIHKPQKVEMPTATHLSIEKFHFQLPVPYAIYVDFESIITPNTQQVNDVSLHEPCGYFYVVIGPNWKSVKSLTVYRGIGAAKLLVSSMLKEEEEISSILKKIISLSKPTDEEKLFKSAVNCQLCGDELKKDRVRDYDHLTGKYKGSAHNICNLNYKLSWKIPVILHNGKHFDTHIIMQAMGQFKDEKIDCSANSMEKYITSSVGKLQFVNS
ncbi:hypothetical protein AVEN_70792-1 [Araneus ventricosus]|uniref:DNA-directed DNA polymerase n=1 Tax=Araneus ventricosus TaxID=182803 RepID=A0A4Y2QW40_ARAVE|nr:hypothetical protein AVEN_70792-1 [Araneus ventricosus]